MKKLLLIATIGILLLAGCVDQTIRQNDLTSYTNDRLKLAFSYPKDWGAITEKDELPLAGQVRLNISDEIFLVADNGERGGDRGGYWGDYASFIKSESDVTNFCGNPFTFPERIQSCNILKNNNGISYAKTQEEICTEGGCFGDATNYYFYNPNSEYTGIVMSSDRLKDNNILDLDKKLDEIAKGLRFLN